MSVEDSNKPEISVNQNSNIAVTWSSRLWQTNKQDQGVGISSLPLPPLDWADTVDVWEAMRKYETLPEYERDAMMFERHPNLQPRMRAILVDWLNEVSMNFKRLDSDVSVHLLNMILFLDVISINLHNYFV